MESEKTLGKPGLGHEKAKAPASPPRYEDFFPRSIDFFGIGRLALASGHCSLSECASAKLLVGFQVSGDEQGLCAVAYETAAENEDDLSMLVELANVVASKLVTELADANCADIMISPPASVAAGDPKRRYLDVALQLGGTDGSVARRYELTGQRKLTLRLAYLPAKPGGNS